MGLETSDTIQGLNEAWPLPTDPKSEGDNHLRMIKKVLRKTIDDSNASKITIGTLTMDKAANNDALTRVNGNLILLGDATTATGMNLDFAASAGGLSAAFINVSRGKMTFTVNDPATGLGLDTITLDADGLKGDGIIFDNADMYKLRTHDFKVVGTSGQNGFVMGLESPGNPVSAGWLRVLNNSGGITSEMVIRQAGVEFMGGEIVMLKPDGQTRGSLSWNTVTSPGQSTWTAFNQAGAFERSIYMDAGAIVTQGTSSSTFITVRDSAAKDRLQAIVNTSLTSGSQLKVNVKDQTGFTKQVVIIDETGITMGPDELTLSPVCTFANTITQTATQANLDYPVGSMILARCAVGAEPNRNNDVVARLAQSGNVEFQIGGTGGRLTGTWRSRGAFNVNASNSMVMCQRVA